MSEQDWTGFHIEQAYRAAEALRGNERRLGWQELEHLLDARKWLSEALERAEEYEAEAEEHEREAEDAEEA